MSLTQILKEFTEKQLRYMQQYGANIVAWEQTDDYEMMLYKDPHLERFTNGEVKYQIGFQRKGMDFTDMNQVMNKNIPDDVRITDLRKLVDPIEKWLRTYDAIGVGSNNREKAETYKRIFDRLGFNVETKELEEQNQLLVYLIQ